MDTANVTYKPEHGARIVAIANQKGGVAKTTTAVNLATCLSSAGKRVLLVDLDPQGGCAICIGVDSSTLRHTTYTVLLRPDTHISTAIMRTEFGFDALLSNIQLAGAEVELKQLLAQESVLRRQLEKVADDYDYILIDTPPSLGLLTVNGLTAAGHVIIPLTCEYMALKGLVLLIETIDSVSGSTNAKISVLGVLITKFDGRTLNSREIYQYARDLCGRLDIHLFEQRIGQSVRFLEAPIYGKPFVQLYPAHPATVSYRKVAAEIVQRLG